MTKNDLAILLADMHDNGTPDDFWSHYSGWSDGDLIPGPPAS